jgi:hypothetical protein
MKKINLKNLTKKEKKISHGIIIFFILTISIYGYRCISEKVCEVDTINKFVRHDVTITMPNGAIVAEVVDTKASRELGLSGRTSMRDNEGMLFVFDYPGQYGFWMKDMNFPLDIIWISQNGYVVYIEQNMTPESYLENPPKTAINNAQANYVLEMNAGMTEQYGLFLGSRVTISQ